MGIEDWKTLSIRLDWSAERLRSFWNCASRHQGKPNDCARASAVIDVPAAARQAGRYTWVFKIAWS